MDDGALAEALQRSGRALERIERALASRRPESSGGDEELRASVREAVAELDQLIRQAGG